MHIKYTVNRSHEHLPKQIQITTYTDIKGPEIPASMIKNDREAKNTGFMDARSSFTKDVIE